MPTYLDFDSTKSFRDFVLSKTLSTPNGPKTFTTDNYTVRNLNEFPNIDLGDVTTNLDSTLVKIQNSNVFKPLEYSVKENLDVIPRKANLNLYPYFQTNQDHNLISIMNTSSYDTESELFKFSAWNLRSNPDGPIYSRIKQNLETTTVGKVRLIDALNGSLSTAVNIITGKEPLIEANTKITVAKTLPGKSIDFLQTVSGIEFPWSEIPGDYLSNPQNPIVNRPQAQTEGGRILQDVTGVLGSLIGIQRRPLLSRKPSDLFIEYLGERQKSILFDNLSYSKYAPDYTTTARSQNSSKIFNFIDNAAESVKNLLGMEAPKGTSYIGDDRGNDVKYAMGDFNDRPVRSGYYLTLMFDSLQSELFEKDKNIGEGGGIGGNLTWISSKSKNKLGANNKEYSEESSLFETSLSTNFEFREDSILGQTQGILETLPTDGGASRSHVANVIDQTSRIFREGNKMLSRGSAIKYINKFNQSESGVEYCRVWTKDRPYFNNSDTMRRTTNVRKYESSILSNTWNLNIYPNSNGNKNFGGSTNIVGSGDNFYAKKYMFSIENLAWKTSNVPGFSYEDLPYCERGPNNGRIMWFPPYDLKINETNAAGWQSNTFLGRPEPIYTYQNTERGGTLSFKVVVDHPSILNLLVRDHFKGMSDEESDNYINAFFAGCEEVDFYDLIRKYTTLTPNDVESIKRYLNKGTDPQTIKKYKTLLTPIVPENKPENEPNVVTLPSFKLYFKDAYPRINSGGVLYSKEKYDELYNEYVNTRGVYINDLNDGLRILTGSTSWGTNQKHDFKQLTGIDTTQKPTTDELNTMVNIVNTLVEKQLDTDLQQGYSNFTTSLQTIKTELENKKIKEIKVSLLSSASPVSDDNYNLKLSYRRSHSVIQEIFDKINNGKIPEITWGQTVGDSDVEKVENTIKIPLKDLGYDDNEGFFIIEYVKNTGEQQNNVTNSLCTEEFRLLTSPNLRRTSPTSFGCRMSDITISYTTQEANTIPNTPPQVKEEVIEITDLPTAGSGNNKKPPIDELKRIIMKVLSECYYFKKLEEDSPVQFSSLKEKLRYFHPGFHSMTPEGLNSRLTFLNQCVRPGDTIPIKGISDSSDLSARNTSFGPPPILILRIGDFYHSKIIARNVDINFDEGLWDFNPEGIGMQPMLATVTMQISFIGGQGLNNPVERLQNALSSNFYANTEMYDPRSIMTENKEKFSKEFLEQLLDDANKKENANNQSQDTPTEKITKGEYIGTLSSNVLSYTSLVNNLYENTQQYFSEFIEAYNLTLKYYDSKLLSMFVSPTYRIIKDYTVQTGAGTDTIELLGDYKKGNEIDVISSDFKLKIQDKIRSENISTLFGFNKDMSNPILVKSEEILNPYVVKKIGEIVDEFTSNRIKDDVEQKRNSLIVILDKLNFILETSGRDGKIVSNKDGESYVGANLSGYTYDKLYDTYSDIITFIKNNHSKFTEDLDESYVFSRSTTMTSNDLSYFLSVLLKNDISNIIKIYEKDKSIFTDKIRSDIEKRLKRFMKSDPSDKNFRIRKYPIRKNSNNVEFVIEDETYTFSDDQIQKLKKVNTTSYTKTTSTLNYYRS